MTLYGLIGRPLTHSFSQRYFREQFEREGDSDSDYLLFPLSRVEVFPELLTVYPTLRGINVTIPYKEKILPYLDELDETARAVGAVNTIRVQAGKLTGYNTDVIGFEQSLTGLIGERQELRALVLGTGGAAKAIHYVLDKLEIPSLSVSRDATRGDLTYEQIDTPTLRAHSLIINTTPLGTYPQVNFAPKLPYEDLTSQHLLFDLVYNPEETLFLKHGKQAGAATRNGYEMLRLQADAAWAIWQVPLT